MCVQDPNGSEAKRPKAGPNRFAFAIRIPTGDRETAVEYYCLFGPGRLEIESDQDPGRIFFWTPVAVRIGPGKIRTG